MGFYEHKLGELFQQAGFPYSKGSVPNLNHALGFRLSVRMAKGEGTRQCKWTRVYDFAYCAIQDSTYFVGAKFENIHSNDRDNDEALTAEMSSLDEKVNALLIEKPVILDEHVSCLTGKTE